jgi:hypothetical protein
MDERLATGVDVADGSDRAETTRWLGVAALASVGLWVLIVIVLHGVKSDLDPVETYISDYAIGDNGWLMTTAFVIVGLGMLCLAMGLRASLAPGKRVLLGVILMAVTGVGFILAGIFTTDPTGADETTTEGSLHLLGSVLVFPVTIVNSFVLLGVFRRDPRWASFAERWRWAPWVLLVGMIVTFNMPEEIVGLAQRVFAAMILGWFAAIALGVMATSSHQRVASNS